MGSKKFPQQKDKVYNFPLIKLLKKTKTIYIKQV